MIAPRPKVTFEDSLRQALVALHAGRAATAGRRLRALPTGNYDLRETTNEPRVYGLRLNYRFGKETNSE